MKNPVRNGLGFGLLMAAWYIIADIFIFNDHDHHIWASIVSGLIGGAVAGLLFGWLFGLLGKKLGRSVQPTLESGEEIVYQSTANHFKGVEAVGGKLFLTNRRLLFQSHSFNIQNHQLSIDLSDVQRARRYKPLGVSNNGLKVHTSTGQENFVVDNVAVWLERLAPYNNEPAEAL